VQRRTDHGSHTSAHSGHDDGVAQTVFVFHEFHAENVLSRNSWQAGSRFKVFRSMPKQQPEVVAADGPPPRFQICFLLNKA
jgi:hypothetical protein